MASLRIPIVAALILLLCGCRMGGGKPVKRKPLFGGEPEPSLGTAKPQGPPARAHAPSGTERLLVELRQAQGTRRQKRLRPRRNTLMRRMPGVS